jgi:thiol-disulfide isomerase/thioredoxin
MKIGSIPLFLLLIFCVPFSFAEEVPPTLLKSLPGLQGSNTRASDKFDFIVLDFWASWCGPCQESMPFLEKQSDRYKDLKIKWLSVNEDQDSQAAIQFLKDQKLNSSGRFVQLKDEDRKLAGNLGIDSLPRFYVLDSNYKTLFSERGFTAEKRARIEKELQKLFAKSPTKN